MCRTSDGANARACGTRRSGESERTAYNAAEQTGYSPMGNAQPWNAVKLDHGRCAPGVAGESHGRDHEEDAEVGHNDKMALFSGEQDRVR